MKLWPWIFGISLFFFCSCQQKDAIAPYDVAKSYVYFGTPRFNLGSYTEQLDSLVFSFAFEADSLRKKTLAFPVQLIGQKKDYDRAIGFRIRADQTTLPDSLLTVISPVMRAGRFQDTLFIQLGRNTFLRKGQYHLVGELYSTDTFDPGGANATRFHVVITDQLSEPSWWINWRNIFGEYKKEVFKKWIEIYYPGVDPTPPLTEFDHPHFAWDNMPFYPFAEYYPVTFFYIDRLKRYFEEHVVYPDGDTTKPRILLPER